MRCFWEQTGVLGPIYRLLSQGVNDGDIARKLNLTEVNVRSYIASILRFLKPKSLFFTLQLQRDPSIARKVAR